MAGSRRSKVILPDRGPGISVRSFNKGKKMIVPTQYLLYLGLLTVISLLTLILVVVMQSWIAHVGTPRHVEHYSYYKPTVSSKTPITKSCHIQVQTYSFRDGKVKWTGVYSYMTRGLSMHCFMARAAKRLGPDFRTTVRIGLADVDVGGTMTFQPSATEQNLTKRKEDDHEHDHEDEHAPPLLFPDSTFESWPEVHDYSLSNSIHKVMDAATSYGLPGTGRWRSRDPKALWRGAPHGKERIEMMKSQSRFLNVKSTSYNMTASGLVLSSASQISRHEHCAHRFLIHMNGIFNNRYSSSVKWKLLCGSLVFVPTEPLFVEWWNYNVWKPNVHYVPYTTLDDLLRKIEYYSNHLEEAAIIARNGMLLAQESFRIVHEWVDDTLTRYAEATKGKDVDCIYEGIHGSIPRSAATSEFKSLEELQRDYGARICA